MSATPVVELNDVCFAYESEEVLHDAEEVLHNVSFSVGERDLVAMVGPNGGGKSTILKLILGLIEPRLGEVRVFGQSPERARRRIGYVPQDLQYDPGFPISALDLVQIGRIERHWLGPYRRRDRLAAYHALEQVGMAELARRPLASLSGGERQRVLIAQALATEPDLLLLDEPTASVDAAVEARLYALLKELNERLTIVVVSHNVNVVTRHASHIVCVNRTATIHRIDQVSVAQMHAVYGSDLAMLQHDAACQIFDPSQALGQPHRAESAAEEKP